MIVVSRRSHIKVDESKQIDVCYNLISEDGYYSVDCFVDNSADQVKDHYTLSNFTKVKEIALHFFQLVVKANVLPVHIEDIWEDYIT